MILAGKVLFLMLVFMFLPALVFGGLRGGGFKEGNVFLVSVGAVGFITLQWLL
jgi:hypothetical protein